LQIDFPARELTIKLVYYGPALSGKTTNLQSLHAMSTDETRGRLMTLETRDDRTLFFDLLPLTFTGGHGFSLRVKLFTVPGQVIHASTRRLVLQGADGVAFIADSQVAELQNNAAAFRDLKANLKANNVELGAMPLVIQFNKRDLPAIRSDAEIAEQAKRGKEPVFTAIATRNEGTLETFVGLLFLAWRALEREHDLSKKFSIDGERFLADIAERFGGGSVNDMLKAARCAEGRELRWEPSK
jgi:signal recognition particle receptor subunit beta